MSVLELGLPARVPATGPVPGPLPQRVTIWEVGPRDGLQNEKTVIGLDTKLEFLGRLADAGLRVIETTSFVHPQWVPQLADAGELLARLDRRPGIDYPVLVPNERGLDRALAAGVTSIAIFASATETFARRNLNRSLDGQFAMFDPVVRRARDAGLTVRGYLSMCFGDPWEGVVPAEQAVAAGKRLLDAGCTQLCLGDTIGVATPGQVTALLAALADAGIGAGTLGVHFHDTYGQALANTLAALQFGVSVVDSSAGGLGGCPFAGSATGNLATEDLVWMLDGLGVEHGVDLGALAATSVWLAGQLGRPSPSRVVTALGG
jgi:hydroxymethylglutaryl-CoA lyase